jgi:hypothetical protein
VTFTAIRGKASQDKESRHDILHEEVTNITVERKEKRSESQKYYKKPEGCQGESFPQKGDSRSCWLRTWPLFALASSEDVGKREFSGKARVATNVAATPLAATFYRNYYSHTIIDHYP